MAEFALHHVSLIVTDLPRSLAFYQNLFGLTIIERPPFKNVGAWLFCGVLQVHLIVHPPNSFRSGNIDNDDCHFAFRTDDFDCAPRHADRQRGFVLQKAAASGTFGARRGLKTNPQNADTKMDTKECATNLIG